jgi:hypothetical protein
VPHLKQFVSRLHATHDSKVFVVLIWLVTKNVKKRNQDGWILGISGAFLIISACEGALTIGLLLKADMNLLLRNSLLSIYRHIGGVFLRRFMYFATEENGLAANENAAKLS